ncbi:hypothetical protein C7999DRAFT_37219 [Corynascus novoguineensis]|uniref:Uncharacterized protein n=1 Tax=Corynascus novoguineensis TaxID=1126955 RepID=A0AAN7D0L2_9PEZI|nr:hypothetical protein C7999DRAFT_37219 [Corynascus novoguineensis]
MPSVAQEAPTVQSSKKRRRDDNDHQLPTAINSPRGIFADRTFHHGDFFHPSSTLAARKIMPLPFGKRQRTTVDINLDADAEPTQQSPYLSPSKQIRQELQRPLQRAHLQTEQGSQDGKRSGNSNHSSSAPLMSRCHICSRRPNKKSDLDSFADCQGCGQRTCYVCIRECLGWGFGSSDASSNNIQTRMPNPETNRRDPSFALGTTMSTPLETSNPEEEGHTSFTMIDVDDEEEQQQEQQEQQPQEERGYGREQEKGWTTGSGHRQVVCSRCCVEKGQDGEVVCLGCLPFVEG